MTKKILRVKFLSILIDKLFQNLSSLFFFGDGIFKYRLIKGVFLNLASQLALESRLRTHHSCKSVKFKQLIRDLLSV
jgi:hypothetical protein